MSTLEAIEVEVRRLPPEQAMELQDWLADYLEDQAELNPEFVASIERGPRASGVYATVPRDGASITLLDRDGHAARTLGSGAGLIAASRQGEAAPAWVVTGTDQAGLQQAAAAFSAATLRRRFAVAVAGGTAIPLPTGAP